MNKIINILLFTLIAYTAQAQDTVRYTGNTWLMLIITTGS
jgi:hypothetical protein